MIRKGTLEPDFRSRVKRCSIFSSGAGRAKGLRCTTANISGLRLLCVMVTIDCMMPATDDGTQGAGRAEWNIDENKLTTRITTRERCEPA